MLSILIASVALSVATGATELFDRNLAYSSPFVNTPHVSDVAVVSHKLELIQYLLGSSCHTTHVPSKLVMSTS